MTVDTRKVLKAYQQAQKEFEVVPVKDGKRNGNALNVVYHRLADNLQMAGYNRSEAYDGASKMKSKFRESRIKAI